MNTKRKREKCIPACRKLVCEKERRPVKRSTYLLVFFVFFLLKSLPAASNQYYFKKISLEDGLPSTIRCIYAEEKGFVWVGTKFGLGRFDGYELKRYSYEANNPNALPHNYIHKITGDKQQHVWILTDRGIARYRPTTDDFYIPKDDKGNNIIAYSCCTTDDGIIFGGWNELYKYDYATDSVRPVQQFASSAPFSISSIGFWAPDTLLCCNRWLGSLLINVRTGEVSASPLKNEKEIRSMMIDSHGRIWISSYNKGIRCYSHEGDLLASYTTRNSQLTNNVVLSMAERDNEIWIGTDGGGINILDPKTGTIKVLEHVAGNHASLPVNSILSLHNDSNNNIWAGTIRSGLINIRLVSMKVYTEVLAGNDEGLSNSTVLSLYQGQSERLWIGTDGGGLNSLDLKNRKFRHYATTARDKIASVTGFTPGNLLLSVFSEGLFIFNPVTGSKTPLVIVDRKTNERLCNTGKTVNLYQSVPGSVWLLADSIYRYDIASKSFYRVEQKEREIVGTVHPVTHTAEATYLNDNCCIYALNHSTNELETVYTIAKNDIINSVSVDEQGIFWIGSRRGLSFFDPAAQTHQYIATPLFTEVNSVICDRKGKVWIGTDGMLFARLIKEGKFILFGESDSALLNEYLYKPRLVTTDDDVYMGGINGLLCIDSALSIQATEMPRMQLTSLRINDKPADSELKGNPANITIPWDHTKITVRVMSCEQDIFRKKRFRYHIAGLDNPNVDSYDPELVLRLLPPGTYHILASCSTQSGDWTPPQQILTITVLPPWYKSGWFTLLCILLVSGSITGGIFFTLRRKENKLKWAMKEHEQQVYEEKVRFLINISHELRTPLTLIHAPLSRLLKRLSPADTNYQPLKSIFRQSQRMKDLLNMVLDVRKMEVGESQLHLRAHLLNEWLQSVTQDFAGEGEAHGIQIRYRLDERAGKISFDQGKCEIILSNLLINALKHSPEHSEIVLTTEVFPEREVVRISVTDRGCGLQGVDTRRLFTRFYQGNNEQNGSGIGLSYAKILVELHGGSIGATDHPGNGTTFFFELPLNRKDMDVKCRPKAYLNELIANPGEEEKHPDTTAYDTRKHSILIVDDNTDLLEFLQEALSDSFRKIYTARNGREAIELIMKRQPDIVVSDVIMPRMDGYELCKRIKEEIEISHIPVILLTARDDQQSLLYGYKNGADAYLTKPFDTDVLLELIRNRLKNREETKMRYLGAGLLSPEESTFSQADENFLLKMNKIIGDNLSNTKLDITFICKEIGMSRASLYNKLKTVTNMGANEYINKFRMEKAILLITTTDLPFTEIAEKIGFTTSRYFSTAFKQYTGETPTRYREINSKR
ncbi:MAG: response regulator [Parabacteroides sp.]|nr:response regulator [Parabacteroides sp.]